MNTHSFTIYIKKDDVYKDIVEDVETRFAISNYELDRISPKGKNKKVIGLMKGALGGKIMIKFVGLRGKTYSCLIGAVVKIKKQKAQTSVLWNKFQN